MENHNFPFAIAQHALHALQLSWVACSFQRSFQRGATLNERTESGFVRPRPAAHLRSGPGGVDHTEKNQWYLYSTISSVCVYNISSVCIVVKIR